MADLTSIKNNVRRLLIAEYGSVSEDEDGSYFIRNGSAVVYVDIMDWDHNGQNVGLIRVWSVCVKGLKEINKDLAVELTTDLSRVFGSWKFLRGGDGTYGLVFQTHLIGATVDAPELINAVTLVAIVADEQDDKIVRKYGGHVFVTE
jgi:hypothetical protein